MSLIPKPAPTRDAVLAAAAAGASTVPALMAATGRTRCSVNHAVACLRSRGLVSGTSRDGSLAVTAAGRAALNGDASSAPKAGGRPTTAHLVLALVDRGAATVAVMARATGMAGATVAATVRNLVVAGRLERARGWSYRLTGFGAEVLAEYTRTWGPPSGLPGPEVIRLAADAERTGRTGRRRAGTGGRRRTGRGSERTSRRGPDDRSGPAESAGKTGLAGKTESAGPAARSARKAPQRAPVRLGPVPRRRPPFEAPAPSVPLRGYDSDYGLPANPAAARYGRRRRGSA